MPDIKQKKLIVFITIIVSFALLILFLYGQNNFIQTTKIDYSSKEIPKEFDGYTIVHLSDLHNKNFFYNQSSLINKIRKENPQAIVYTGDLVNYTDNMSNIAYALSLIEQASTIAPVYYVSGNHEAFWNDKYADLEGAIKQTGAIVLKNETIKLNNKYSHINLTGIMDVDFGYKNSNGDSISFDDQLDLLIDKDDFNIVLCHRPELFDNYVRNKVDLALTGHAHGGQMRFLFSGALVAPNQDIFPKYTIGTYTQDNTTMVVSRGLGNSTFPQRLYNNPEIISITLNSE